MREQRRQLPPLSALVAFEAAGRHLNFTHAGRELHISQAAVSRQIRQLEAELNAPLFERLHRSVALTEAGCELYRAVTTSFDSIAAVLPRITPREQRPAVGIAANNAVAFYWLRPKVTAFQHLCPDIELAVFASDTDRPFEAKDIDLAIRYGAGQWPDARASLLFTEEVFPVCASRYLDTSPGLARPEDLPNHALLYMRPHGPDWVTWGEWLHAQGVSSAKPLPSGLTFDSYPVLLQAAIEGHGIAIGTRHLLDALLTAGSLVRPLPQSYHTGRGYYLALPAERPLRDAAQQFIQWLSCETGVDSGQQDRQRRPVIPTTDFDEQIGPLTRKLPLRSDPG